LNFYTSRSVSIEAIVPVVGRSRDKVVVDLTQPTMTMTQTFEYRLRKALKSAQGQDQRRTQDDEGFEHESIKDDADGRLFTTTRNTS
jgi:hypothetical protein